MRGPVIFACLFILVLILITREDKDKSRPRASESRAGLITPVASERANATSKNMEFNECLRQIRAVSEQLAVAPRNIVETADLRMVRFPTPDDPKYRGVLITCSRPDAKMVITKQER